MGNLIGKKFMHPFPQGYSPIKDGEIIQKGDIILGKMQSVCGQPSYGWSAVPPYLIGQEYFEHGMDFGPAQVVLRRTRSVE